MRRPIYVYALCNPDTLEPKYVGITKDIAVRPLRHYAEVINLGKMDTPKQRWIRSLIDKRQEPYVAILDVCICDEYTREQEWIHALREVGYSLTNTLVFTNKGIPVRIRQAAKDFPRGVFIFSRISENRPPTTEKVDFLEACRRLRNPDYKPAISWGGDRRSANFKHND